MPFGVPLPHPTRRRWLAAVGATLALAACAPLPGAAPLADPLPSWNEGPARQRIVDFVNAVSSEGGKDYVAPDARIAVFDNDGTLWLEYPMYTQVKFVLDRIQALAPQHPQWQDKEPYRSAIAGDLRGVMAGGEKAVLELALAAQSGLGTEQFGTVVNGWLAKAQDPRFKRPYDTLTYQPMQELLRYLRANGFRTYVSSGGSAEFMRPFSERVYGIPPEQVIGTRQKLLYEVKDGQGALIMQPQIEHVNDGAGKPVGIEVLIGRRPIAAFGNSDGDLAMLQYTTTGAGLRLGMIVHHDDAAREYAYDRESHAGRLDKGLDQYRAAGWTLISMKNDWKTIFAPLE
ncbi:MAG TPA: HAD family hydrolase [Rubrivivax sp.]|nr:HAD family hydrolase [Rubrivivax sp.]